jgi:hypothetical protein
MARSGTLPCRRTLLLSTNACSIASGACTLRTFTASSGHACNSCAIQCFAGSRYTLQEDQAYELLKHKVLRDAKLLAQRCVRAPFLCLWPEEQVS